MEWIGDRQGKNLSFLGSDVRIYVVSAFLFLFLSTFLKFCTPQESPYAWILSSLFDTTLLLIHVSNSYLFYSWTLWSCVRALKLGLIILLLHFSLSKFMFHCYNSFVNSSDKTGFVHLNLDQVLRFKVEWKRRWNGGRMGEGNLDGSKRMELGRGNTMALKTILVIFLTLSLLKHMSASKLGNCCMSQPACRIFVVFI